MIEIAPVVRGREFESRDDTITKAHSRIFGPSEFQTKDEKR